MIALGGVCVCAAVADGGGSCEDVRKSENDVRTRTFFYTKEHLKRLVICSRLMR